MAKILLIRHGQSEGNIKRVFCGRIDYSLTPAGKEQGEETCKYIYSEYKVCGIYASELIRAKQTVEKLSALTGIPITAKKEFNELYGGKWEDRTVPFIAENYPDDFKVWQENVGEARPTGGESFSELRERVFRGLKEVSDDCRGKDGVAVIATHGGVIRTIECVLRGLTLSEMKNVPWVNNASVTTVSSKDGEFCLERVGYDAFLGDKRTKMFMGL